MILGLLLRHARRVPPSCAVRPSCRGVVTSATNDGRGPRPVQRETIIRIDHSALIGHKRGAQAQLQQTRAQQPTTAVEAPPTPLSANPLETLLHSLISTRGPLSVAEFMRLALGHPTLGYYARNDHAVFGRRGDFTTSPEISSMFGDLLAVWVVAVVKQYALDAPGGARLQLVELGPGRGTLMADVLRVLSRSFPAVLSALGGVHLVETSPALRLVQARTLHCSRAGQGEGQGGTPSPELVPFERVQAVLPDAAVAPGLRVEWHDRFSDILAGTDDSPSAAAGPLVVLAHELFDALPVHQFVRTAAGTWRERLVEVNHHPAPAAEAAPHSVAAPTDVAAAATSAIADDAFREEGAAGAGAEHPLPLPPRSVQSSSPPPPPAPTGPVPLLRLVLSPGPTPASMAYAPRAGAGGRGATAGAPGPGPAVHGSNPPAALGPGAIVEVSPASSLLMADIARALALRGGAALVIDYGHDAPEASFATGRPSVRGIRDHAFTGSFVEQPGHTDISADVDFGALRQAALAALPPPPAPVAGVPAPAGSASALNGPEAPALGVFGPITQSALLQALGLQARATRLMAAAASEEDRDRIVAEANRLAHPDHMGTIYKAMAVVAQLPRPVAASPRPGTEAGGCEAEEADRGQAVPIAAPPAFEGAPAAFAGGEGVRR